MVYKLMGLNLPKVLREKFAKGGADFSDYFTVAANQEATHSVFKCSLGLVEVKPDPTDEQLIEPSKIKKEEEPKIDPMYVHQLESKIEQGNMDYRFLLKQHKVILKQCADR